MAVFAVCVAIIPTMVVIPIAYLLRSPLCREGGFIQQQPYLGDFAINSVWLIAISSAIFCLEVVFVTLEKFPKSGRPAFIGIGFVGSAAFLAFAAYANGNAERVCVSDSGIHYRTTLESERTYLWSDAKRVAIICRAGRGSVAEARVSMADGTDVLIQMGNVETTLDERVHLWALAKRLHLPIEIVSFEPWCAARFPGITFSPPAE
jgi:hypothetical protein